MTDERRNHPSENRIQELLDGRLPDAERRRVESHLADCDRCRSVAESWRALFSRLEEVPELAPSAGFAERVMGSLPGRRSLWARIRDRILPAEGADRSRRRHPAPERVLDYLDGALPARARTRLRGHLEACPACREEVREWRGLLAALEALPTHQPSGGFADAVMARVRVGDRAPAAPDALERVLGWIGGGVSWPRALRPRTAGQWALAGVAAAAPVTAAVGAFLVLFSHPQLTPGYLLAFLWWQLSEAAGALLGAAWGAVTESALVFRAYSVVEWLGGSPTIVGLGAVALSVCMAGSLWILYRNLITTSGVDRRYANLSA